MEEQTINIKYERKSSLKDKFISKVKQLSPIAIPSNYGSRSQSVESELSVNGGSDAFKDSTQSSIIPSFSQVSSAIWGFLGLDSYKLSPSTDTVTSSIQVPSPTDMKDDNNNHSISQELKWKEIDEQRNCFSHDISTSSHIEFLGIKSIQYGRNMPAGIDPIHYIDGHIQQNPILLTSDLASALRPHLGAVQRITDKWKLEYSMERNGISLKTLYENCADKGPELMLIRDEFGNIFGAYSSASFEPHTGFFGNGDCFLWKVGQNDAVNVYHATGINEYLILCEHHCIAIGGGEGRFGLWIDENLDNSHSEKCATFDNEQLSTVFTHHVVIGSRAEFAYGTLPLRNINWTQGISSKNQNTGLRIVDGNLFYASGTSGVIHDTRNGQNTQHFLRGHCNEVVATTVSMNEQWMVTSDIGKNALLIVWDNKVNPARQSVPIKIIMDSHNEEGARSVAFTPDAKYLITLGNNTPQTICIWEWTTNLNKPLMEYKLESVEMQSTINIRSSSGFEFMTIGRDTTYFYTWDTVSGVKRHDPITNEESLEYRSKDIIAGLYFPASPSESIHALTVLNKGIVLAWHDRNFDDLLFHLENGVKCVLQQFHLQNTQISALNLIKYKDMHFVITGSVNGIITIYDMGLRILWWHDISKSIVEPLCGAIASIAMDFSTKKDFPDLYILTNSGQILHLNISSFEINELEIIRHRKLLHVSYFHMILSYKDDEESAVMQPISMSVDVKFILNFPFPSFSSVVIHPVLPYQFISGNSGYLQVWNHDTKELVHSEVIQVLDESKLAKKSKEPKFITTPITTMCLSSSGDILAVALKDARMIYRFYSVPSMELLQTFVQYPSIVREELYGARMEFSPCNNYLAVIDTFYATTILQKKANDTWTILGKSQIHKKPVIFAQFLQQKSFTEEGQVSVPHPVLITISQDSYCVQYDLLKSSITGGLKIEIIKRIEQYHSPTSCVIYSETSIDNQVPGIKNHLILSNSDYKLRTINSDTLFVRKTTLGPGALYGEITKYEKLIAFNLRMCVINRSVMGYASERNVVGLMQLPLEGNMHKSIGIIAHPNEIKNIMVSACGKKMFSFSSKAIHTWHLDLEGFEEQMKQVTPDPFLEILESEAMDEKSRYREMEDYFFYMQIKRQGENSHGEYNMKSTVPLEDIPHIMRAMGFFPSDEDIENMINEVKFSKVDTTGQIVPEIDMGGLVRLFVNHKPIQRQTSEALTECLNQYISPKIEKDTMISMQKLLGEYGETIEFNEFSELARRLNLDSAESVIALAASK